MLCRTFVMCILVMPCRIPEPSLSSKMVKWSTRAAVLSAFAWGCYRISRRLLWMIWLAGLGDCPDVIGYILRLLCSDWPKSAVPLSCLVLHLCWVIVMPVRMTATRSTLMISFKLLFLLFLDRLNFDALVKFLTDTWSFKDLCLVNSQEFYFVTCVSWLCAVQVLLHLVFVITFIHNNCCLLKLGDLRILSVASLSSYVTILCQCNKIFSLQNVLFCWAYKLKVITKIQKIKWKNHYFFWNFG